MRTTLTIDDDIAVLIEGEMRRSGKSYKAIVNELLSVGLARTRQPRAGRPFKVTPRTMGLGAGQSYDNVSALLEELEGPEHK